MKGWVMKITEKQQQEGAATISWLIQHLGNFAEIIITKINDGDLSSDDPRIQSALDVIARSKKSLAAL
jgi:hypothetical protein